MAANHPLPRLPQQVRLAGDGRQRQQQRCGAARRQCTATLVQRKPAREQPSSVSPPLLLALPFHMPSPVRRMLPAYGGEAALRGAFFSSLKEAAVVCRGSAQRVMEMAAGAQVGRTQELP